MKKIYILSEIDKSDKSVLKISILEILYTYKENNKV